MITEIYMSKEIKTQHYLPFVYLNQFRSDIAIKERGKSTFYFDNGEIFKMVPVDTQGAKRWFYRKENTKESEESFQKYELDWNTVIENQRRAKYEDFLAFLQILMYHFRNTSVQMNEVARQPTDWPRTAESEASAAPR